jgi:hypothetical protein
MSWVNAPNGPFGVEAGESLDSVSCQRRFPDPASADKNDAASTTRQGCIQRRRSREPLQDLPLTCHFTSV